MGVWVWVRVMLSSFTAWAVQPVRAGQTTDYNRRRVDIPSNPYGQPLPQTAPTSRQRPGPGPLPAPAGMVWQMYFGLALPYSTSDGPTALSGPIAAGFTRTPQGAALAAQHIFGRHLQGEWDQRRAVAVVQTTAADEIRWRTYLDAVDRPEPTFIVPRLFLRPDAFRIMEFTPDEVVVDFAIPQGFTGLAPARLWTVIAERVEWIDEQWKLVVGDCDVELDPITSLDGWTRW